MDSEKKIVLRTSDTYYLVKVSDIMFCKSEGNYTTFFLNNSTTILVSKPLIKICSLLVNTMFIRCHQSYIVNSNYIEKYLTEGFLIISENKIPVSIRRKELVLNYFKSLE